jgi:hypothetical protein
MIIFFQFFYTLNTKQMTPSQLVQYLTMAILNNWPVLIKGRPGIGKSDIVEKAVAAANAEMLISHPVVSDPTDYKGLPFPSQDGMATFLPYGDLQKLITAKQKMANFIDDLGQASTSVQAAIMQLLLARRVNGHVISPHVTFIAATNGREHKAGVTGMLEPVKSRFITIIELEVSTDDWVNWALNNDMPIELIAFIQFRPDLLDKFEPSKDIVNSPCPRTVAHVGTQQAADLPQALEFEAFKGSAGEAFATEYCAFLKMYRELPSIDEIILNPDNSPVSADPCTQYATSVALANKMSDQNISSIITYLERMEPEVSIACMKAAISRNGMLAKTRPFILWGKLKADFLT